VKQEPGSVHVKEELPSVDSGAVTTPKTEPMDGTEDTKLSPMETSSSATSSTPVQSPAPAKPRSKKSKLFKSCFSGTVTMFY